MGITESEIRAIGEEVREFIPNSLNTCGQINASISAALDKKGVEHDLRTESGYISDGQVKQRHHFIVIHAGEVEQCDGEVVVDGAVDQFNTENAANGDVGVCLGSRQELPTVGIFSETGSVGQANGMGWYNV